MGHGSLLDLGFTKLTIAFTAELTQLLGNLTLLGSLTKKINLLLCQKLPKVHQKLAHQPKKNKTNSNFFPFLYKKKTPLGYRNSTDTKFSPSTNEHQKNSKK